MSNSQLIEAIGFAKPAATSRYADAMRIIEKREKKLEEEVASLEKQLVKARGILRAARELKKKNLKGGY